MQLLPQILLSFITILCSGVVAAIVTHKLNARRDEREFMRKKLEELFSAVHGYNILFVSRNMLWPRVMSGDMDYDRVLDINAEDKSGSPAHYENLQMLINIYFPEFLPRLGKMLESRDAINGIKASFQKDYQSGVRTQEYCRPFDEKLLEFEARCDEFKQEIYRVAQRYHS
jgi:hypothetical protein